MPIDSSIYANLRGPDIGGALESGFKMRDMMDARKLRQKKTQEEEEMKSLFASNVTTDADGKTNINRGGLLSGLAKTSPETYMDYQGKFQEEDKRKAELDGLERKQKIDKMGTIADAAGQANPQNYSAIRANLIKSGIATEDDISPTFNQNEVDAYRKHALGIKGHLEQQEKDRRFGLDERKVAAQERLVNQRGAAATQTLAEKSKPKPMTVTQSKQMGLYNQGLEAEKQYQKTQEPEGGNSLSKWWNKYDPSSSAQWIDKNDWVPKVFKSEKAIAAQGAEDRWVEAFLRDASGAAIPPDERGAYIKDFFPVAGDTKQAIADKARARQLKMATAKMSATGVPDEMPAQQMATYKNPNEMSDDELLAELNGGQ